MLHFVTPDYLGMSKLRLLEGHIIDNREISVKAKDLVVSEDFAKRYFPNRSAVGQTINLVNAFLQGETTTQSQPSPSSALSRLE